MPPFQTLASLVVQSSAITLVTLCLDQSSTATVSWTVIHVRLAERLAGYQARPSRRGTSLFRGRWLLIHRSCKIGHKTCVGLSSHATRSCASVLCEFERHDTCRRTSLLTTPSWISKGYLVHLCSVGLECYHIQYDQSCCLALRM